MARRFANQLTNLSFTKLQTAVNGLADFPWGGRGRMPSGPDREQLVDIRKTNPDGDAIGEGTYVQFVAFLLEEHFAAGESVTCRRRQDVDIHLALVTSAPATMNVGAAGTECGSITAEISGHWRPADWDFLGRTTGTPASQKLTKAQAKLAEDDLQRPMRFRGQLMFDASHTPCGMAGGGKPDRVSSWEIHPVYEIDVCRNKALRSCPASDNTKWVPLDEWMTRER